MHFLLTEEYIYFVDYSSCFYNWRLCTKKRFCKIGYFLSRLKIQGSEVKRYLKNVSVRYIYGKMLILTFEDSEEEILNHIISCVNTGARVFQVIENAKTNLSYGDIVILLDKRELFRKQEKIDLSFIEFEILHLLMRSPGRVFSKEQIYDIIWNEPYSGDYNVVMRHICNIREKIEDDPGHPVYIQTVRGVGYRFNGNLGSE